MEGIQCKEATIEGGGCSLGIRKTRGRTRSIHRANAQRGAMLSPMQEWFNALDQASMLKKLRHPGIISVHKVEETRTSLVIETEPIICSLTDALRRDARTFDVHLFKFIDTVGKLNIV